jgi:dipeptidase E
MKFYLSSFHVGDRSEDLQRLAAGRRIGLVPNALDYAEPEVARHRNALGLEELRALGIDVETLDLRDYFIRDDIADALATFGGVWVRGGNTFVLRQAMRLSGFDEALTRLDGYDFLYGGYSAGVCVLAPTLRGLQQVDDPTVIPYSNSSVIWEGLGFLDYLILPHYKSDHPESAAIDREVDYCTRNGIPFRTLRDGEVIIIDDSPGDA